MPSIHVRSLSKNYRVPVRGAGLLAALKAVVHREFKTVEAVKGISFDIEPGERVGFLGPNGAGKTTTLKMLAGLLHPSSGLIEVEGYVPTKRHDDFLKSIMLVMGQKQQLIWDLPPIETFELNRAIYGVSQNEYIKVLNGLIEDLKLTDLVHRPTRQLSLGERMKCELAAALIHQPKVLFLDEPTIGLDVSMQVTIRQFIRDYNTRTDATVLLTSHYMEDVEALCPRVIVINQGKISYDGELSGLIQKIRPEKQIALRFHEPIQDWPESLNAFKPVREQDGLRLLLRVPAAHIAPVVKAALSVLPVVDLNVEDPPLEDVMREVFEHVS